MKIDHRLLLWCVAASVCCAVVKCGVEFFDADGKALKEEDILKNDWILKEVEVKSLKDSYRKKQYDENIVPEEEGNNGSGGEEGGDNKGEQETKEEDPEKTEKCEKECGPSYGAKNIKCDIMEDGVLCTCPDLENVKQGFDDVTKECTKCDCGGNFKNCSFTNGEEKCTCEEKYALKDKKCAACVCEENTKECRFENGQKACECLDKFTLKDGKCTACDCGDHSTGCSYDANREKTCTCEKDYAHNQDTCAACGCGTDSTGCSFDANGEKTCTCKKDYADNDGTCAACGCGTDSTGCSFDTNGDKTCTCKENFADNGGTCAACDCGKGSSNCSFDATGVKTCKCETDFAQKGDKCEACACGGGSSGCSFDVTGKKTCTCKTDFAQKGDTCEACGCGKDSTGCSFDKGVKACRCNDGFAQNAATCIKCECGEGSTGCSFDRGLKTCKCNDGFAQKDSTCLACGCGGDSTGCSFDAKGEKTCKCNDGFAQKDGTCAACGCGGDSTGCSFDAKGEKTCKCNDGFAQKDGTCIACGCGDDSTGCSFDPKGGKTCKCNDGFAQKDGTCTACECGDQSSGCSFDNKGVKTCTCKKGFAQKGAKCVEEACVKECGNKEDAKCNVNEDKIECVCEDPNKKFDPVIQECRRTCAEHTDCEHGASCEDYGGLNFCECPEGTEGDMCEIIIDCTTGKYVNCTGGARGKCQYDQDNLKAVCICQESRKLKDISGYCAKCDCGVNSEDCNFLKDKKTCKCKPGFAEKSSTSKCEECNCGDNSVSCSFVDNKKTCICKEGFGDNGGTCQKCNCGENVKSCSFKDGQETCICKNKFAVKEGKCAACDCGEHSNECRFEGTNKVCDCKSGFNVDNGICKECNCGVNSTHCEFEKGKKICTCTDDNAQKDGTCLSCECGENTKKCRFENGQRRCDCLDKFALKDKKCTDCNCGDESTGCSFKGNKKTCVCKKGYGDKEGQCTEDKCVTICGVSKKSSEKVNCDGEQYGDEANIKCKCFDTKLQFDYVKKECRETCDDTKKCANFGRCEKQSRADQSFCNCLNNTEGHLCQILTECGKGKKFEKCTGKKGQCTYKESEQKAYCKCDDKTLFDEKEGHCQLKCSKDSECPKGKICSPGRYCTCEEGKSGDNCEIVPGCTTELKNKCKKAGAECTFVKTAPNYAACVCNNKYLEFVENDAKCIPKFCKDVGCASPATCEFDSGTNTAHCKCPDDMYYDYKTKKCSEPDKCLLRKVPCKENYVCNEGKCECVGKMQDDKCIKEAFCNDQSCFPGAICNNDTATCKCDKDHYFTGSSCKEVKCIKDPFHQDCPCPAGTKKDENSKKCVPEGEKCEKDCGLGYCSDNSCICIDGVSILEEGKCILDKDAVCASRDLLDDSKTCNCTGIYKLAEDKITCELVTCDNAQECKNKGAQCKMAWTGDSIGYKCQCPTGYVENKEKGICTDPCSVYDNVLHCAEENQVCYNSYTDASKNPFTCGCAPPFKTSNTTCDDVEDFTYLISGIPVLKQGYQMEKTIDYVKLNNDLMQSLSQMYDENIFNSGYLHNYVEDGDVLKTSVWVRFNQNISGQLRRFTLQAKNFPNISCEDCDTDLYIWPPQVVLKGKDFKDVKTESLTVCAKALRNTLCGEEADCNENKCFCPRGYRTLEFTIKNIGNKARILRCEKTNIADIDECASNTHDCPGNTTCVKIPGSYICECKPGYWKSTKNDKKDCLDLCARSPCAKGTCSMKKERINCNCDAGYGGSYCDEADVNFAAAKKSTVVVGAVLGTILILFVLAALFFYVKKRKSSYSEDFTPAPRQDLASEMRERRPIRGVVNTSYE